MVQPKVFPGDVLGGERHNGGLLSQCVVRPPTQCEMWIICTHCMVHVKTSKAKSEEVVWCNNGYGRAPLHTASRVQAIARRCRIVTYARLVESSELVK
jgi:hypothetical protein